MKCLSTVGAWPTIVVDNASSDGSVEAVKSQFPKVTILETGKNIGFAAGNNFAIPHIKSDYLVFLNPDTEVKGQAIEMCLKFLESHSEFGAATCKVELPDGKIDYSCHRGLPSPWNTWCYFMGLAKLFPGTKLFAGYTATYLDINKPHEIDCATGAFLMVRKTAGEQIGWWDEDYFWNGDDIEFCFKLRQANSKIMYLPQEKVIHYKGSSSGLWETGASNVSKETKLMAAASGTKAMKIFLKKHYGGTFGAAMVNLAIFVLEKYRLWIKYR